MARSSEPCELTSSTVVACAVQTCWDCYIDNTITPDWSPAVSKVECEQRLVELGSTRKSYVFVDSKHGHTVEQCTAFEPLKRIEFNVLEETFGFSHMLTHYGFGMSFDVDGGGTLMVMKTHYTPKKIFASVMNSAATQRQIQLLMSESLDAFSRYASIR